MTQDEPELTKEQRDSLNKCMFESICPKIEKLKAELTNLKRYIEALEKYKTKYNAQKRLNETLKQQLVEKDKELAQKSNCYSCSFPAKLFLLGQADSILKARVQEILNHKSMSDFNMLMKIQELLSDKEK